MLKFYLGIALMCVAYATMAIFFSEHAAILITILLGIALVFVLIAISTRGSKWRW